jgi:uncharacterized membrane protein YeaQ/YmgE (transglycosylase-associated protein family)
MNSQGLQIIVEVVMGLIGAVVTPVVAQLIKNRLQKYRPRPSHPINGISRFSIIILGVCGGLVGVVIGLKISPIFNSPCNLFSPTQVDITSPISGSTVPRLVTVQGTACRIPKDKELWVLVVPDGVASYYPQTGPVVIASGNTWSTSAYLGVDNPTDAGKGFSLVAVLADRQGGAAIRTYFAQQGPNFIGLEPLPTGVQLKTEVRVIRK